MVDAKIAISIDEKLLKIVDILAGNIGMSRSAFLEELVTCEVRKLMRVQIVLGENLKKVETEEKP